MAEPTKRPGSLVESKTGFDPRIIAFHGFVALMLVILGAGLAYQQLIKGSIQSFPGPARTGGCRKLF